MFWNYFTVAWRNLLRHPLYAAINVVGLAVSGLRVACWFCFSCWTKSVTTGFMGRLIESIAFSGTGTVRG